MAPPSKARPRVAYDLGRRGEPLPDDWHDDPDLSGSYELGVDDRDAAAAGSKRRHGRPDDTAPRARKAAAPVTEPSEGDATPESKRDRSRREVGEAATSWRAHPLSKGGGGGLFLGVIGYCVLRALLTEGPHGIWRWYSAKFMNQKLPRRSTASAPSVAATPAQPSARVVST